jgi:UDP-2-acetamido-2-deoxy-ribo-hexuluronate aminotransferase
MQTDMSNASTQKIEFVDLKAQYQALKSSIDTRIQAVLDHGQFIMGPEVAQLEQQLAAMSGAKHCITCASGTEALLIALMALGIKPGDEVITTPFTFIATAEVIVLLGAKPVYVDIEPDTCNIDVSKLQAAITPRTRAIMPVSLYGQPADMDEINAIASARGIPVVEDAAQSFGARYRGRWSCNLSTIGCTSFFPSKPLGCYGDGGAVFTDDDKIAELLRSVRVHGQGADKYDNIRIGMTGRLDTIQAAVLIEKLKIFPDEIEARNRVAARYAEGLKDVAIVPEVASGYGSIWAQYTIRVEKRDALAAVLSTRSVPTAIYYPKPLHRQEPYKRYPVSGNGLPVTEKLAAEVIALPMHPYLDEPTQARVIAAVREALA